MGNIDQLLRNIKLTFTLESTRSTACCRNRWMYVWVIVLIK